MAMICVLDKTSYVLLRLIKARLSPRVLMSGSVSSSRVMVINYLKDYVSGFCKYFTRLTGPAP